MRPEVADVKYIGKTVFQHQSVGGLCMPSPNFGWGEGLNTPAPPAPLPTVPMMLIGKVDQCWRIWIFLYGHFLWVRVPQFPKIQVKGDGEGGVITWVMAILVRHANKPRWARAVKLRGD